MIQQIYLTAISMEICQKEKFFKYKISKVFKKLIQILLGSGFIFYDKNCILSRRSFISVDDILIEKKRKKAAMKINK